MRRTTQAALGLVMILHLALFVAEAIAWSAPAVHERVVPLLNPTASAPESQQAEILGPLLTSQGAYNLFLALGLLVGAGLWRRGSRDAAATLALYICAFAVAAGSVLAASTELYAGALAQAGLGLLAAILLARDESWRTPHPDPVVRTSARV